MTYLVYTSVLCLRKALSVSVIVGTHVGRGSQPTIECLTSGLSRGMNGVTLGYCYSGDYPIRITGCLGMPGLIP